MYIQKYKRNGMDWEKCATDYNPKTDDVVKEELETEENVFVALFKRIELLEQKIDIIFQLIQCYHGGA